MIILSVLILKLGGGLNRNVIVTVIYRPPNTDTRIFNERLNAVLNCVNNERKLCYLMGDYNVNILNYDYHSATAEFVDMLYSHAFLLLINRPTRTTQTPATIIDNIFTNNIVEPEWGHNGILVTDINDHFLGKYSNISDGWHSYKPPKLLTCKQTLVSTGPHWNRLVWNVCAIWHQMGILAVLLKVHKIVW